MNLEFERKLPIPQQIKTRYPVTDEMAGLREKQLDEIKAVFRGESQKKLLVIGPCSAEAKEPVLEYISRLRTVADKVAEKLVIIPRIYTNKPRTTGAGYKGMLHQPDPNKRSDMLEGIVAIRELHMKALSDYGFCCADEMLYPENHRYLSDLLAYVAVGARSVEDQQHRLTASGLNVPVGMKNSTGGDLNGMLNAVSAAQSGHTFIYRGWQVHSKGNEYAHAILRGYTDFYGRSVSNYHYENLALLNESYNKMQLKNPSAIVDCNHANSGKQYLEQIRIAKDVVYSCNHNNDIKHLVKGLMIESYLEDGAGDVQNHLFGQSITDACLGWEKTEKLIYDIADTLE